MDGLGVLLLGEGVLVVGHLDFGIMWFLRPFLISIRFLLILHTFLIPASLPIRWFHVPWILFLFFLAIGR
jgi:hypothetical protein